jgi:ribonuclease HII
MKYTIGIDEVGRGPIAGPVAVGAFVILDDEVMPEFKGVKESKQLSFKKREFWFEKILEFKKLNKINFSVNFQTESVIDNMGISHAIRVALNQSIKDLNIDPENAIVLLDGGLKAPLEFKNQKTIIKGDEKEIVIALASICSKVLRDRKMIDFDKKYPGYNLLKHMGYGTKAHYDAIEKHGLLPIHRKSFLTKFLQKKLK